MFEPTHSCLDPGGAIRSLAFVLLFAVALPMPASARDAGNDTDQPAHDTPETAHQSVQLEQLAVYQSEGSVVVDLTIDDGDWERLAEADITLWMDLRIPTDGSPTQRWFRYTLPIDKQNGHLRYPDWLSTSHAEQVGLCMLGTRPGDQLAFGQGYVCSETLWLAVERRGRRGTRQTIDLSYHRGLPGPPYAPWMQPQIPGFPHSIRPPSP
jgi:hypothetical protein